MECSRHCGLTARLLTLRAYSHQAKANAKRENDQRSKTKRKSKNKRKKTSKEIVIFASTFARCDWTLR